MNCTAWTNLGNAWGLDEKNLSELNKLRERAQREDGCVDKQAVYEALQDLSPIPSVSMCCP